MEYGAKKIRVVVRQTYILITFLSYITCGMLEKLLNFWEAYFLICEMRLTTPSWISCDIFKRRFVYLFLVTQSLLMHVDFPSCGSWELLSNWGVWASHCSGFSCCRAWALGGMGSVVAAPGPWSTGLIVVVHRLSCPEAWGIFTDQGSNWCALHWQVDS